MKPAEITKELTSKREALRQFRFSLAGSKSKNIREGRNLKREIARLLTTLNSPSNKENK
jgi:ribosomal protein L29